MPDIQYVEENLQGTGTFYPKLLMLKLGYSRRQVQVAAPDMKEHD